MAILATNMERVLQYVKIASFLSLTVMLASVSVLLWNIDDAVTRVPDQLLSWMDMTTRQTEAQASRLRKQTIGTVKVESTLLRADLNHQGDEWREMIRIQLEGLRDDLRNGENRIGDQTESLQIPLEETLQNISNMSNQIEHTLPSISKKVDSIATSVDETMKVVAREAPATAESIRSSSASMAVIAERWSIAARTPWYKKPWSYLHLAFDVIF